MNYIKSCLIITMLLGIGYSQCDANGDGDLNIQDVVIEVNCILTPGCWDGEPVCEDIDGNVYETIQIGEQLWMAENLKVTHYNDNSEIPTGYSGSEWAQLETGAYAVYDDDPANSKTYGRLYNWYTVDDDRGVCPEGWHVPSDDEWTVLSDYLGGTSVAGGKMKSTGTIGDGDGLWNYYSDEITEEATNESGFTALPAGYRSTNYGYYGGMGSFGYFWSSSEYGSNYAWSRGLSYGSSTVFRSNYYKHYGFSVRCLGD